MTVFALAIFASFFGLCFYLRYRARRELAADLRVRALIDSAAFSSIDKAPSAGRIVIGGNASSKTVIIAPFSGQDALWARSWLQTNVGDLIQEWKNSVDEIVIDDRSGRVAKLRLSDARVRLAENGVGGSENRQRIADYLHANGFTPSTRTAHFPYESVLRPGDDVRVFGTIAASDAGYRESSSDLQFSPDDELIVFNSIEEPRRVELRGRLIGCMTACMFLFGFAIGVTLLVMIMGQ